jgi:hypothetical protein
MTRDAALDSKTGDWLFSSNTDLQAVVGDQVVQQRIMTRVKMSRGWLLDPTRGSLGSLIRTSASRLSKERALNEVPLMIKEALAPMDDIELRSVVALENPDDIHSLIIEILYVTIDPTSTVNVDSQITESLAFEVGV